MPDKTNIPDQEDNRVCKSSATAFAAQLSGEDPVGEITAQMVQRRLKQRQKTLLAMVRGAFGSAGASGVAAPLKAVPWQIWMANL